MALGRQRGAQVESPVDEEQLERASLQHRQVAVGRLPAILREGMEAQKEPETREQKKLP